MTAAAEDTADVLRAMAAGREHAVEDEQPPRKQQKLETSDYGELGSKSIESPKGNGKAEQEAPPGQNDGEASMTANVSQPPQAPAVKEEEPAQDDEILGGAASWVIVGKKGKADEGDKDEGKYDGNDGENVTDEEDDNDSVFVPGRTGRRSIVKKQLGNDVHVKPTRRSKRTSTRSAPGAFEALLSNNGTTSEEEEVDDEETGRTVKNSSLSSLSPLVSTEVINKELVHLENRARAVLLKEWEVECMKIQFESETDRKKATEALQLIKRSREHLDKIKSDIMQAAKLTPNVEVSQELTTRYTVSSENLAMFFSRFEQKLDDYLSLPLPTLPPAPKADEMSLSFIPDRPDGFDDPMDDEEDECVWQLLSLSQDPSVVKPTKRRSRPLAAAPPSKEPQQSPQPDVTIEPTDIVQLQALASSIGLPVDEHLYELTYSFESEYLSKRVAEKFTSATNQSVMKSLRGNFSDIQRPTLPNHIDTKIVCLPPLAQMAGRLPSCGLCGLTVRREHYRGRALKNGTKAHCLVHTYHAHCLAYLKVTCCSVCIAPMMGVASPCNLNERNRSGN